jgi:hypothetical protein
MCEIYEERTGEDFANDYRFIWDNQIEIENLTNNTATLKVIDDSTYYSNDSGDEITFTNFTWET